MECAEETDALETFEEHNIGSSHFDETLFNRRYEEGFVCLMTTMFGGCYSTILKLLKEWLEKVSTSSKVFSSGQKSRKQIK